MESQNRLDVLLNVNQRFLGKAALHQMIAKEKIDQVFKDVDYREANQRREFFRVTLDEIKEVVRANFDKTVEFVDFPPDEQYRQSLAIAAESAQPEK